MTLAELTEYLMHLRFTHPEYDTYEVRQRYETCCATLVGKIEKVDEKKGIIYLDELASWEE